MKMIAWITFVWVFLKYFFVKKFKKIYLFMFSDYFDVMMLKIIFKK
jgi:hypothetical protein